jgi:hypothetical protein
MYRDVDVKTTTLTLEASSSSTQHRAISADLHVSLQVSQ